jgi:hypothetical protein
MNAKALLVLALILLLVIPAMAQPAKTTTANIRNLGQGTSYAKNITLYGYNTPGQNITYWVEFGLVTDPLYYPYKSNNVTGGGNFSVYIEGLPLMACRTFYFRWSNATHTSTVERFFTMATVGYVPPPTFANPYQTIRQGGLNITKLPFVATTPYTDLMGNQMVWGLIFAFVFIGYWIMQEDITIPVILGLITSGSLLYGGTLSLGIPPEFVNIAQSLLIISVIGLVYTLFRKRG